MSKLITFFLFMMIGTGWLTGIMAGGGGTVTTDLSANVTDSATAVSVLTTTDFYVPDYVIIDDERVYYAAANDTALLGCTRGYLGTTAASHEVGARVYTRTAAAMNYAVGFNIVALQDRLGWLSFLAMPIMFVVFTLPQIIKSGTNLLTGDMAVLLWIYYAMAGGFIITLAWTVIMGRRVS